jgi:hypothetical protein
MLNEQLTGTKIGNATVYSVAVREGFEISSGSEDIPLIFTFFVEEEDGGGGEPGPAPTGPEIEVMFDVEEIMRVVEEDVMLAAEDLGLNVTIEDFVRFDGCPNEDSSLEASVFSWEETSIGGVRALSCPCEAADLRLTATRECGGNFTAGASWLSPLDEDCVFTPITNQLCSLPELETIEDLVRNVDDLDILSVAVVAELLGDMVTLYSGNASVSDTIFNVIEDVLRVESALLLDGQLKFNSSGRLLSYLETLADAYPTNNVATQVTREEFHFFLLPSSLLDATVTVSVTYDNRLIQGLPELAQDPARQARARVDLTGVDGDTGLVTGVYNPPDLFVSRRDYIQAMNRSSYVLGSKVGVISVHFAGQLARTELDEPVVVRFWKTEEAENGTRTECVFWDQSLDEGYGAWSTEGCELVLDSDEGFADCRCTHLTQFTLLVDLTPEPVTPTPPTMERVDEDDDSIGPGSYVGGLVCIVFLLFIIITYLIPRELRSSVMGVSLINSSLCLCALFLSYLVSYHATGSDWACTVFSALFHYLFLVASLSLLLMALLKSWQPERLTRIFLALLTVQLVLPALVVIISAAPDQDNYINDEFCRPQREPYWYGLLLLGALVHVLAWVCLFAGLCLVHIRGEKVNPNQWFQQWLGVALTLLVFELAWGFGLPSTNSLGLGATRLVFQIVFLVGCVALGVVELIFFVLVPREAREVWTGLVNRCIPGRSGGFDTTQQLSYGVSIETNPYTTGGGTIEMSKAGPRDEEEVSAAKRSPEAEAMTEKSNGEDPEHIVNPQATEQDDEDGGADPEATEVKEAKMDLGMFDDDADAAKDTKL